MQNRIQEIRKQRKITQEQLADLLNTTKQQIFRLEHGKRQLTQKWLNRLSQALNCSIMDLLPEEKEEPVIVENFADLTEEEKDLIRNFRKSKAPDNQESEIAKAE